MIAFLMLGQQVPRQVAEKAGHAVPEGGNFILEHVVDSHELELPFLGQVVLPHLDLFGIDISITKHVVMLWVAAFLVFTVFWLAFRRPKQVPSGLANALEAVVVFVRDEIVLASMGERGRPFLPYFLTVFFFILFANLLGLVPYAATATSNLAVTATLATLSFILIQIGGIIHNGFFGYFKSLIPPGLPVWLLPIMIPVELLGLFTKPFALAIRLFANMTAGHIVILALLGLIFTFQSLFVAPLSVLFAVAIDLLEILVALVQAYIFTMLSAIFVGMAVHPEH